MRQVALRQLRLPSTPMLRLQAPLGRWRAAWSQLAARERKLVMACAALVVAVMCWLVAIEPALIAIAHWQSELPRLRSQTIAVESVVRDAMPRQPAPTSPALLAAALAQSLDQAHLQGSYELVRSGPPFNANEGWRLTVTKVPAQALMPWLLVAPQQLHFALKDVTLLRTGPAGSAAAAATVSGTVHLVPTADVKEIP